MGFDLTSSLWGLGIGVLASLIVAGGFFFVDKRYPHVWHRWRFRNKKNTDSLIGKAHLLHSLQGKKLSSLNKNEEEVDLKEEFPPPKPGDANEFDLENVRIVVNPSREALFTGTMKYQKSDNQKTADVSGTGNFVYKDEQVFDGFVALDCTMTESGPKNAVKLTWTVSCFLRRDPSTESWDGFWFLFDRQEPRYANFGTIKLTQDPNKPS